MKISSSGSVLTIFWLLTLYQYFPLNLIGAGEIYPWYALPAFWCSSKRIQKIFLIIVICAVPLAALDPVILVAVLQLSCAILACFFIVHLHPNDKRRSLEIIYKILMFLTLLMLIQRAIPQFSNVIPELLTSREGRGIDHRTGGVRGIAPEPSYMAASILSLWICAAYLNRYRLTLSKHLIFALSVFLTGSLLGILGVTANLLFLAIHQTKINLTSISRFAVKREFLYVLLISAATGVLLIYWSPKSLIRLIDFALNVIAEIQFSSFIESVIHAEERLQSSRLQELMSAFSFQPGLIFTGEFDKSFSVFGQLGALFGPLHWVLYAFILTRIRYMYQLVMLGFFFLYGPVSMIGFSLIVCAIWEKRDSKQAYPKEYI